MVKPSYFPFWVQERTDEEIKEYEQYYIQKKKDNDAREALKETRLNALNVALRNTPYDDTVEFIVSYLKQEFTLEDAVYIAEAVVLNYSDYQKFTIMPDDKGDSTKSLVDLSAVLYTLSRFDLIKFLCRAINIPEIREDILDALKKDGVDLLYKRLDNE
jgi:hypothetical protein